MYTGRLIFSQLMDHLPMPTFRRCVERYQGDRWVKSFRCVEHYRCMAFAQLTYRESLRDIEACLRAQGAKLYHMGIRGAVSRSTLADANEQRDWRIYADFAQRLIHTARRLYVDDALALELDETVYALDSSTIDLCLTLFPWADFRKTKAAVKLHTLLDRHFPANLQIHGNRIYIAPPRELHSLRSPPMTRLWRADHVRKAIWQRFPPSRHTSPVFSTLPSISSAYAGTGLRRRSSIKAKIFWNKIFDTATSASWNVT